MLVKAMVDVVLDIVTLGKVTAGGTKKQGVRKGIL
jgi:hypothetical protein